MDAFYEPDGDALRATPLTRGPWDDAFQHGGPPSALLARAIEDEAGDDGRTLARIVITFRRPVPIGRCVARVAAEPAGKLIQRLTASLEVDGAEVLTASALRIRRAPVRDAAPTEPPWPAPEALAPFVFPFVFPFFPNTVGYHTAVDLRLAYGTFGATPIGFWARPRIPLVAGEATSPIQTTVILADAQSGMGLPLRPDRFSFVNPDLTVAWAREPAEGWIGLDIRSLSGGEGAGLSQSLLRDPQGLFGGCSQCLVVAPR